MKRDRINHTLQKFRLAFASLEQFLTEPIRSNRDRAGVIQAFEFTYELAWKTFQKMAQEEGLHVATPRQAFSSALQAGYIPPEEEETWIGMMRDRNLTSHTYHESLATEIAERIQTIYFPVFKAPVRRLDAQVTSDADDLQPEKKTDGGQR